MSPDTLRRAAGPQCAAIHKVTLWIVASFSWRFHNGRTILHASTKEAGHGQRSHRSPLLGGSRSRTEPVGISRVEERSEDLETNRAPAQSTDLPKGFRCYEIAGSSWPVDRAAGRSRRTSGWSLARSPPPVPARSCSKHTDCLSIRTCVAGWTTPRPIRCPSRSATFRLPSGRTRRCA